MAVILMAEKLNGVLLDFMNSLLFTLILKQSYSFTYFLFYHLTSESAIEPKFFSCPLTLTLSLEGRGIRACPVLDTG
jgi:hypothetical protein